MAGSEAGEAGRLKVRGGLPRAIELPIAFLALMVLSPFFLAAAIAIKLDTPGPVFHRGLRVGRQGREFRLFKLRTMVRGAASLGPAVTFAGDSRVTKVGRLLRRYKLDELPQLLNVVLGQMSLVGPRPEDPRYVAVYTPEQRQVLEVRPGITGIASLEYRDEEDELAQGGELAYVQQVLPAKLQMELDYLKVRSPWRDLALVLRSAQRANGGWLPHLLRRHVLWILIDVPVIAGAYYLAVYLRYVDAVSSPALVLQGLPLMLVGIASLQLVMNEQWSINGRVWRYATGPEILLIFASCATTGLVVLFVDIVAGGGSHQRALPIGSVVMGAFFTATGMTLVRYRWRIVTALLRRRSRATLTRTVIYGAGETGQLLADRLVARPADHSCQLLGFIDDNPRKRGMRIHGLRVIGDARQLNSIVARWAVDLIIVAISSASAEERRRVLQACQSTSARIKIAPDLFELVTASAAPLMREVTLNDLLGRSTAQIDRESCAAVLHDQVVLVTGASGSVGSELCRQICGFSPRLLVALDNNESGLHDLGVELRGLPEAPALRLLVADITDEGLMRRRFGELKPQVVFHAAAYKHVPMMEEFPEEAVRVNVRGTQVVLEAARAAKTDRFVLVSTDKAVRPSSVMGATKRIAELLVTHDGHKHPTRCTAVRFGNVLGSRGSVVPTFARQIETGGPVTVTDPAMTRFFMEVSEAAMLIIQAAALTTGSDLFMLEMGERVRIDDLARRMIRLRGLRPDVDIKIEYTGVRPGEKLHEELIFEEETRVATGHPLIYRITSQPDGGLLARLPDLLDLTDGSDPQTLVSLLLEMVPTETDVITAAEISRA